MLSIYQHSIIQFFYNIQRLWRNFKFGNKVFVISHIVVKMKRSAHENVCCFLKVEQKAESCPHKNYINENE